MTRVCQVAVSLCMRGSLDKHHIGYHPAFLSLELGSDVLQSGGGDRGSCDASAACVPHLLPYPCTMSHAQLLANSRRFIVGVDLLESECLTEKGAELRLTEIKRNTNGFAAIQDGKCDTYVHTYTFSLASNFNKLTPVGICNLNLPWMRRRNAKKLRDAAPPDGFSCVRDVMESVKNVLGLSNAARKEIKLALKEQVSSGTLSFGSKIVTLPKPSSLPPQTGRSSRNSQNKTKI